MTRLNGWRMWLKDLPRKELVNELDTKWKPIFRKMMEAPGLVIPAEVDEDFVQSSFCAATNYIKSTVSYIWIRAKDKGQISKYTIGTWSRKVACSEILKHGTAEDKARLPPSSARNKADGRKRGGWSVQRTGIRRVARRARTEEVVDNFERNFHDIGILESVATSGDNADAGIHLDGAEVQF